MRTGDVLTSTADNLLFCDAVVLHDSHSDLTFSSTRWVQLGRIWVSVFGLCRKLSWDSPTAAETPVRLLLVANTDITATNAVRQYKIKPSVSQNQTFTPLNNTDVREAVTALI